MAYPSIEAAAAVVGLILLTMVIAIIVVLVVIIRMRNKMREQSKFTIQISRNYSRGESFRAKESPISDDIEQQTLKDRTLDLKVDAIDTLDNPLYQQTTSFSPTSFSEPTNGFTNPQSEQESLTDSDSLPKPAPHLEEERYIEHTSDTKQDLANGEDIQVTPSKPPTAMPRPSATPSSRRLPPMVPIVKPKPYVSPTSAKPPVSEKPVVVPKPSRLMQPMQPPTYTPPAENQGTGLRAKPDVKPKPKALPRKM